MNKKESKTPGCEGITPYGNGESKGAEIEQMFDNISPAYDKMNTAMSLGLHKRWRNKALQETARLMDADAPLQILDIATGTGDVAFELNRRFPNARIVGMDISDGMLAIAREKLDAAGDMANAHISFRHGDSLRIPSPDNKYDLVTVAYGVRNFQSLEQGYREMCRVLRPGGRLCVIELSEPANGMVNAGYRFYSETLIPRIGRIVSGDRRAYSYLLESIANAPQRGDMAEIIGNAGFSDVSWKDLTSGVVTVYRAVKPAPANDNE